MKFTVYTALVGSCAAQSAAISAEAESIVAGVGASLTRDIEAAMAADAAAIAAMTPPAGYNSGVADTIRAAEGSVPAVVPVAIGNTSVDLTLDTTAIADIMNTEADFW